MDLDRTDPDPISSDQYKIDRYKASPCLHCKIKIRINDSLLYEVVPGVFYIFQIFV